MTEVGRKLTHIARPDALHSLFYQPNPGFAASDGPELSCDFRQRHVDALQAVANRLREFDHIWIIRNVLGRPFAERSHERSPFHGEL
jgi:hypothetical protein